jgi:baculoviral IAP repeat-containing protein 6
LILKTYSALKQAIDSVLCAFCCVKPTFFQSLLHKIQIFVPNLSNDQPDTSISDDRKESEGQTDDGKSIADLSDWYARLVQSEFKHLSLTEGQLLSIAAAARSPPGICQLIDSGLPTLLTACIMEFTILERSKLMQEYRKQQQIIDTKLVSVFVHKSYIFQIQHYYQILDYTILLYSNTILFAIF